MLGDVLINLGTGYYVIFLCYIAFYTWVVTNTITSLFIETTMAYAEKDTQHVITDKLERKDEYVAKLQEWFNSIDENGDGMITYDQFARSANDPEVMAFAETLEIELFDLKQFFSVLSANNKRPVNLENFVIGCIKLKGMAKSMDLMDLMYTQKQATEENARQAKQTIRHLQLFEQRVEDYQVSVHADLQRIHAHLASEAEKDANRKRSFS